MGGSTLRTLRVLILGGGAAGLSAANELSGQPGLQVEVAERAQRLGGLHRSVRLGDYWFDIGAFVFNPDHVLLRTFPFLLERFVEIRCNPLTISITEKGTVDRYPLTLRGYARDHGLLSLARSVIDVPYARVRYRSRASVADYARFYLGPTIFRNSGLEHYIERLYDLDIAQIDLDFAVQRLQVMRSYLPSRRLTRWLMGRFRPSTPMSNRLVRPPGGFDVVYEAIQAHLAAQGIEVRTNVDVKSIRRLQSGFEVVTSDRVDSYDEIISTIPIPALFRLVGATPSAIFDQMHMVSLFYRGRLAHRAPVQSNFTRSGRWKRLVAPSAFYGQLDGDDYWVVEATTRQVSSSLVDEIRSDFERHAAEFKVTKAPPNYLGSAQTPNAYPVFRVSERRRIEWDRQRLQAMGLRLAGRQGRFEYLGSGEAAAQGATQSRQTLERHLS